MLSKQGRSSLISLGVVLIGGLSLIAIPALASGSGQNNVFQDPCRHDPGSPICQNQNPTKMEDLVKSGLNILMWAGGIITVIMIVYAGYLFVRSSGDPNKVSTAKNIILYAVIGLIVIMAANAIVAFVIDIV